MIGKYDSSSRKSYEWQWILPMVLAVGLTVVILIQGMSQFAAADEKSVENPADSFAAVLDEKMPGLLAEYDIPGAVVSYIQDGAVAWTKAFGVSDRRTGTTMRPDQVFCTGSASKLLTAWGIMHLVEQGQLDLDSPVDYHLKRWHLSSPQFDPSGVTIRRLLSHTAGLTVEGYTGYSPRRSLPNLEQVLDGRNQGDGAVYIGWEPGSGYHYSGGGYTVLQMVIENVTGEPYTQYMKREILAPLGLTQGDWVWTPALKALAPTPYGYHHDVVSYNQFATFGIGNYISSVADYAKFIAAAVPGPNGEPAGRGVLKPETITLMMTTQPNSGGYGFGYATEPFPDGTKLVEHGGASGGWVTIFALAPEQRNGFVFAAACDLAQPLRYSVYDLWATVAMGKASPVKPEWLMPTPVPSAGLLLIPPIIAGVLGIIAIWGLWRLWQDIRSGRRSWQAKPGVISLLIAGLWFLFAVVWIYYFHTSLPLPLPSTFPDIRWPPEMIWTTIALMACISLSIIKIFYRRQAHSEHFQN